MMSSPLSSLKKEKKLPFEVAKRLPPFRRNAGTADGGQSDICDLLLDRNSKREKSSTPAISDMELMSSMMTKLAQTEKKLKESENTNKQMEKEMKALADRCALLEKHRGGGGGNSRLLEEKCQQLQLQVQGMEQFLEDYGMIWVGNNTDEGNGEEELTPFVQSVVVQRKDNDVWNPAVSTSLYTIDFDLILNNINELNQIASEDQIYVNKSKDRAQFCKRDAVALTLYRNGIFMFEGPFRDYSEPETMLCMQDLMEGYFPTELQDRYPNGVVLDVSDKRNTTFNDKRHARLFPGSGKCLASEQPIETATDTSTDNRPMDECSEAPVSHKKTIDQLLQKLPPAIVKQGVLIDVRSDLSQMFQGKNTTSSTLVVDTEVVMEMRERMEKEPDARPPTPGNITTLRVKSEEGSQIYLLKMRFTDTIGMLYLYLDKVRNQKSRNYILRTSFPSRTYTDETATMADSGLVPNAVLMMCSLNTKK